MSKIEFFKQVIVFKASMRHQTKLTKFSLILKEVYNTLILNLVWQIILWLFIKETKVFYQNFHLWPCSVDFKQDQELLWDPKFPIKLNHLFQAGAKMLNKMKKPNFIISHMNMQKMRRKTNYKMLMFLLIYKFLHKLIPKLQILKLKSLKSVKIGNQLKMTKHIWTNSNFSNITSNQILKNSLSKTNISLFPKKTKFI